MSGNKKYGKIEAEDLLRYISGEMSDTEKHAIEREIQKDPFAAEALEGLSMADTDEARKDLSKLKARLNKRVSGKRSMVWLRVAASVAIIATVGTLYFTVFSDRIGQMDRGIAETESVDPDMEPGAPEEKKAPVEPAEETISRDAVQEETPEQEPPVERITSEVTRDQPEPAEEYVQVAEELVMDSDSVMQDEIFVSEFAAEAEELVEVAVQGGETLDVTLTQVAEIPEPAAAARSRESTLAKSTSMEERQAEDIAGQDAARMIPDSIPAMPSGGMELFNRYIADNLRFPESDSIPGEGMVVLSFRVGPQGRPQNIDVDESPGEVFSQEAIRLLQEGPDWSPLIVNGVPSDEKVRVNIEFRRD